MSASEDNPQVKVVDFEEVFLFKAIDGPRKVYNDDYTIDCPACNSPATGTGVFCEETKELLKNNYIACTRCDWDQAS